MRLPFDGLISHPQEPSPPAPLPKVEGVRVAPLRSGGLCVTIRQGLPFDRLRVPFGQNTMATQLCASGTIGCGGVGRYRGMEVSGVAGDRMPQACACPRHPSTPTPPAKPYPLPVGEGASLRAGEGSSGRNCASPGLPDTECSRVPASSVHATKRRNLTIS